MNKLEVRNQKIIDAVLEKEKMLCPGAIALIGIYGSFQTGDVHPLSDLDLLILINDERHISVFCLSITAAAAVVSSSACAKQSCDKRK